MNTSAAALALIFGLLQCFAGYRFFRFALAGTGFALGAASGASVAQLFTPDRVVIGISGAVLGLALVWLVTRIFLIGVFILGGLAGAAASAFLLQIFHKPPLSPLLIPLALVWGITAVVLQRWAVIVATAGVGAAMVIAAALFLHTSRTDLTQIPYWALAGWVVLGSAGTFKQLKTD